MTVQLRPDLHKEESQDCPGGQSDSEYGFVPRSENSFFLNLALVTMAATAAVITGLMFASTANAAPAAEKDEYSFNWLDPDKQIYVLQNRRYGKAGRTLFSVTTGPVLGSAYRTSFQLDPRAAYYFSEAFGIEAFYTLYTNKENSNFRALGQASGVGLPVVREPESRYGLLAHWVPWYAKINVFNKILYFDWYFSGGAGFLNTTALQYANGISAPSTSTSEQLFSTYLGTGHQYHLTRDVTVRLDVTGTFYRAPLFGTAGEKTWFSSYSFGLGLGFRL